VVCLAPRAPGDSVRPRRLSGVGARPLNFAVRRARRHGLALSGIPRFWLRLYRRYLSSCCLDRPDASAPFAPCPLALRRIGATTHLVRAVLGPVLGGAGFRPGWTLGACVHCAVVGCGYRCVRYYAAIFEAKACGRGWAHV
jgi:hypothetical protein